MSYHAHWLLLIHVIHVLIFCISNISSVFFFCEVEAQSWSHVADQASTRSTSPEVGPGESQGRGDIQRGAAQADPQLSDASGALGRRTMFRKFLHFCAANMSTYHPKVLKDKYSETTVWLKDGQNIQAFWLSIKEGNWFRRRICEWKALQKTRGASVMLLWLARACSLPKSQPLYIKVKLDSLHTSEILGIWAIWSKDVS